MNPETAIMHAILLDASRGDSLSVLNSAFSEEKETVTELPLWKQPEMIELAKDALKYLLIAGIGLFLLLGVIRPAFRNFTETSERLARENAPSEEAEEPAAQPTEQDIFENNLQSVKQMAQQDPKIVATVIKEWVNKE